MVSATNGEIAGEQELLAAFRLRTATVARNAAWITIAGIAALTIPHHRPGELDSHAVVWILLALAAVGNLFTYLPVFSTVVREARTSWPLLVWTLLLLLFDAAVVFFSHDTQHGVYLIYIPVLLLASTTLDLRAAAGALLIAAGGAIGAMTLSGELSRDVVVGSASSFGVVSILGAYLAREHRSEIAETARQKEKALERGRELAALNERTLALNDELQQTVTKVINAQERERHRIGRELHDEAVQLIATAVVHLGDIEQRITSHNGARESLMQVRDLLTDTLWEIRKIIADLRPTDLDDLGLVPALSRYVRSRFNEANIAFEIHTRRSPERLPAEVETALFRIAQEAVNNVVRHAQATHAVVTLDQQEDLVELRVEDDGIGINGHGDGRNWHSSFGLLGMKERAALLNGEFSISRRDGGGTIVQASVPLVRSAAT